jgi:outer membrane protein OmpA-like peptidoglycan-associated protein
VELTWQLPVQLDLLPSCAEVPQQSQTPPPTEPDATSVTPSAPTMDENTSMLLDQVVFPSASIALRQAARTRLMNIARQIQSREAFLLELSGHADDVGDPDSNLALSLARAYRVRAYLIELGVPISRVVVRGYGSDRPLVDSRSESARARNRRVELSIRPVGY